MIHHNYYNMMLSTHESYTIWCSQGGFGIDWETVKNRDYFDLRINPQAMAWTATLNDTGDGTNWASIVPATGTGTELNMYAVAAIENPNPVERTCTVTFSDDAAVAADLTLTITQMAAPV